MNEPFHLAYFFFFLSTIDKPQRCDSRFIRCLSDFYQTVLRDLYHCNMINNQLVNVVLFNPKQDIICNLRQKFSHFYSTRGTFSCDFGLPVFMAYPVMDLLWDSRFTLESRHEVSFSFLDCFVRIGFRVFCYIRVKRNIISHAETNLVDRVYQEYLEVSVY